MIFRHVEGVMWCCKENEELLMFRRDAGLMLRRIFFGSAMCYGLSSLGSFLVHFGLILGSFWVHFGLILGSFWAHFGLILGSFWAHIWLCVGRFWAYLL